MVGSRAVQFETWVLSFEARGLESKVEGALESLMLKLVRPLHYVVVRFGAS